MIKIRHLLLVFTEEENKERYVNLHMLLHIKNMVCDRCIMVVEDIFLRHSLQPTEIKLGEVLLSDVPSADTFSALIHDLEEFGFGIIDDRKNVLAEKVKNWIVRWVYDSGEAEKIILSEFLSQKVHRDYSQLSGIFSEVTGQTVEQFFIAQKIERVKEWLQYGELTLSQMADKLHYSSVAHLSNQFKKITGISPSRYKLQQQITRTPINKL